MKKPQESGSLSWGSSVFGRGGGATSGDEADASVGSLAQTLAEVITPRGRERHPRAGGAGEVAR